MSLSTPLRKVRYVLLGSTGVGKSKLGNRLLGENTFAVMQGFIPGTAEPSTKSVQKDDVLVIVTDTIGFNDPCRDSNDTVRNLATMLQEDEYGPINRFILVQNGKQRFSADMADNIRMLLNSFHEQYPCISIVLTHLDGSLPIATTQREEYKKALLNCFKEESLKEKVSKIEIFSINNSDKNPSPIPQELDPKNPNQPAPIDPHLFRPKGFEGEAAKETEKRFIEDKVEGDFLLGTQVDRWRWKTIPFTNKGVYYSDWVDNVPPEEIRVPLQWKESRIKAESSAYKDEFIHSEIYQRYKVKPVIHGLYNPDVHYTEYLNIPNTEQMYETQVITKDFNEETTTEDGKKQIKQCKKEQKIRIDFEPTPNGWVEGSRQVISEWREVQGSSSEYTEYYEYRYKHDLNQIDSRGIFYKTNTFEKKGWKERRYVKQIPGQAPEYGEWEVVPDSETSSIERNHKVTPLGGILFPSLIIAVPATHIIEGKSKLK